MSRMGAPAELERARAAKARLATLLADHPAVNGIGLAMREQGYELRVNLADAAGEADVPPEVDGVPVRVVTVGPVHRR